MSRSREDDTGSRRFGPQRLYLAVALVLAGVLAVPGWASSDDSLERARKNGVRFGFSNELPGAYMGPDGKPAGWAAEMVTAIFKRVGVNEVKGVLTEWASLIPGLKAGRVHPSRSKPPASAARSSES